MWSSCRTGWARSGCQPQSRSRRSSSRARRRRSRCHGSRLRRCCRADRMRHTVPDRMQQHRRGRRWSPASWSSSGSRCISCRPGAHLYGCKQGCGHACEWRSGRFTADRACCLRGQAGDFRGHSRQSARQHGPSHRRAAGAAAQGRRHRARRRRPPGGAASGGAPEAAGRRHAADGLQGAGGAQIVLWASITLRPMLPQCVCLQTAEAAPVGRWRTSRGSRRTGPSGCGALKPGCSSWRLRPARRGRRSHACEMRGRVACRHESLLHSPSCRTRIFACDGTSGGRAELALQHTQANEVAAQLTLELEVANRERRLQAEEATTSGGGTEATSPHNRRSPLGASRHVTLSSQPVPAFLVSNSARVDWVAASDNWVRDAQACIGQPAQTATQRRQLWRSPAVSEHNCCRPSARACACFSCGAGALHQRGPWAAGALSWQRTWPPIAAVAGAAAV